MADMFPASLFWRIVGGCFRRAPFSVWGLGLALSGSWCLHRSAFLRRAAATIRETSVKLIADAVAELRARGGSSAMFGVFEGYVGCEHPLHIHGGHEAVVWKQQA
eukprot:CAMPEP_0181292878 /NCGR_PEP_ID=MMETSP1101-20121128/2755_1 /TAXON_ID=46948 /ORGANISM="Rhodomonas abbreviata, Strain Caron Lab Isolate" /LENGTH=104 /DNA_ID=CAMNT_0023397405 /DNA_START=126 /DNA_END=437 /DNA_ORIENTATION=+